MARGETVESIMRIVRESAPELGEEQLEAIARGIHDDLGGRKWYIGMKPRSARMPAPDASTGAASQGGQPNESTAG